MKPITLCVVLLVILCNFDLLETRKLSGGGRRTTGSRPSSSVSKPRPSTTFSHSNSDIARLSYGQPDASAARRPASPPKPTNTGSHKPYDPHKPSAPPADHNNHQASAPRQPDHNAETANKNIGWNTQNSPNTANNNPNNPNPGNIGWNVPNSNTNTRPGQTNIQQQHVNQPNAPPPYPGAPGHNQNLGPPPPYPGNPSHGQNFGQPPPPYSVHNPHQNNMGAPPGYNTHQNNYGAPPGYPGYGGNHYNQPGQPGGYPGYGGYGGHGGYGGPGGFGGGNPQSYGYGASPGGFGGMGGLGGLGGFGGGGGYGGGYGGYGGGGGGLFAPKRSGISGTTLVGGALLGLTLYSLTRDRNHYHYYSPYSQQQGGTMNQNNPGNVGTGTNTMNVQHTIVGDQGSYTSYVGNMTCVSIYNANEVSRWANGTLQDFYKSYPQQAFPVSVNGTNEGMNFTIVPGEIIHNETLGVTCCGISHGQIDLASISSGKAQDANCVYKTFQMPFRKLIFIPVNSTAVNSTSTNTTNGTPENLSASTAQALISTNGTTSTLAPTSPEVSITNSTTTSTVATTVENQNIPIANSTTQAPNETTTPPAEIPTTIKS